MGVIFQNGFGVGTVPNNTGNGFWNPNYTSNGLVIHPYVINYLSGGFFNLNGFNSSIVDNQPGVYASLGYTAITSGQKRMVTFGLDFDEETSNPNYTLGFGTTGTNLENFLGVDTNSIGITNEGNVLYNNDLINIPIFSGLPTFGNVGDIIDIAINGNTYMWYRVNGGDWNGDNTADPATNSGGLLIDSFSGSTLHPAIALGGFSGPSVFSVYETSPYGLPSGFTQIAGDRPGGPSFTITSSMFDGGGWANSICGSNGQWSNNLSGITVNQAASNLYCGVDAQLTTYASIEAAFIAAGGALDWHGYVCSVNWGPGSTISNGYAKVAYNQINHSISISTIDTTDTDYLINNNNANDSTSLAGTFNFPATFTILAPLISKGGWC